MKKMETCRRAELLVLMILEARIHERRQEDDKKEVEVFLISAALLTIIFVSIERYNNYIGQKVYQESTQGLFATYEQLDKTF